MKKPASPYFRPIDLSDAYNEQRSQLPPALKAPPPFLEEHFGDAVFHGIPFHLGPNGARNVIHLAKGAESIVLPLPGGRVSYLVFLHVVENRDVPEPQSLKRDESPGNAIGGLVSTYTLNYADGTHHVREIQRRFAIQQQHIVWGASPFAAIPTKDPKVHPTKNEVFTLEEPTRQLCIPSEGRVLSGRDQSENLWLYALLNPDPDKLIESIVVTPQNEESALYGLSLTDLTDHPLRGYHRRKLLLHLPKGAELNKIGEYPDLAIDLGEVISARQQYRYDPSTWSPEAPNVQPEPSTSSVVVEFSAHPKARLHVGKPEDKIEIVALSELGAKSNVLEIPPALRPVKIRILGKQNRQPVPVRLHMHGESGEYLPPKGYHRKVNTAWAEDISAEFANIHNQYAYINGECIADLPLGRVYVEVSRGYEFSPLRTSVQIGPETEELVFEIERVLDWRAKGWFTADTHVHFLSPTTAELEASAEDVNVVNLLASQWGEMFSNVGDFDGKRTHGSIESGGNGEFLVRVGSENRMQTLGHISLLGYRGALIHPLCTGGPSESALGDPQEATMADWAERCRAQGGLVVMPHAPLPQCERAADMVLGVVDAVELMCFNPHQFEQLPAYGLADWYKYQNLGYHCPLVGGTDKMSAAMLLGGLRTYTQLGDTEFNYESWMEAVRAGNTFITVGPLVEFLVEGRPPGTTLSLPEGGGTVQVSWRVESLRMPIERIEVIHGGETVADAAVQGALSASASASVKVDASSWLALRVRGSYKGQPEEVSAHTSAVQVLVAEKPVYSPRDAVEVLTQIEGSIAFVDTLATRGEAEQYKRLRLKLETAWNTLHQRMHRNGVFHHHTPVHDHVEHHEH